MIDVIIRGKLSHLRILIILITLLVGRLCLQAPALPNAPYKNPGYNSPMHPILTRHGSFFFYSYTAVMGLGLLLSLVLIRWQTRQISNLNSQSAVSNLQSPILLSIFTALLAGRAAFVAANWEYYTANLDETWLLWQGGYSYHGALVAGFAVLWAWLRWRSVPFEAIAAVLALPIALWSAFGWFACYLDGCAYGRETVIGPLAADLPDNFGVFAVRYQTQLIGLILSLLTLVILWWLRRRVSQRTHFWLAILLLSAARALVDALRGDPVPLLNGIRLDLLLDATLALLAGIIVTQTLLSPSYETRNEPGTPNL